MANKINLKDIYADVANKIVQQKLRRANWLQRLIIKKVIKQDEDTKL